MNILFTCSGRRNYLLKYFKKVIGSDGMIFAADLSPDAPTIPEADRSFIVSRIDDPTYIDQILTICTEHSVDLLISLNDLELPVLALNKERFRTVGTTVVVSSFEVIDRCFDKWKTLQFLEACGLRAPETALSLNEARQKIQNGCLRFPLIVKPRWGSASIGIERVRDIDELEMAYALVRYRLTDSILAGVSKDLDHAILIQELLGGDEYGLDIVNDLDGNNHAVFVKQKLAMRAGETDRAVTLELPVLEALGSTIGANLGHVGNLDCDVFWDGKSEPCVLEMNPRFGGGYPFSHVAGSDVPAALCAWWRGEIPDRNWLSVTYNIRAAKCDRLVLTGDYKQE